MRLSVLNALLVATVGIGVAAPAATAQDAADDRPGVAVFMFGDGGSIMPEQRDLENLGRGIQSIVFYELAANSSLKMVDRIALNQHLAEIDLGDRVDPRTAAEAGKVFGARYAVVGEYTHMGPDHFIVNLRVVDVETSLPLEVRRSQGPIDDLYPNLVEAANGLVEDMDLPPLERAEVETRQERAIPGRAVVLLGNAAAARQRGETAEARRTLELILDRYPHYTEAQEEMAQLEG